MEEELQTNLDSDFSPQFYTPGPKIKKFQPELGPNQKSVSTKIRLISVTLN